MINLNTVDRSTVETIARLRFPEMERYLRFLSDNLDVAKSRLVHATDTVEVHRLQGRAAAFEDLLKAVDDSVSVLTRTSGA